MLPQEAALIVGYLVALFGEPPGGPQGGAIYALLLAGFEADEGQQVAQEIALTEKRFPSPAVFREIAGRRRLNLPSPADAWQAVAARVNGGEPLHPLVRSTLDAFGGMWAIRTTDKPEILRAQFLRAYEQAREIALREWSLDSAGLPAGYEPGQRPLDEMGEQVARSLGPLDRVLGELEAGKRG